LELENHSRISPLLQQCCLITSANESYAHAAEDVAILTGMNVSKSAQQRLVHEVEFTEIEVERPVAELSVDGGKVRLITPKEEPSEWRDYKVVNIHCEGVEATFQENEKLIEWINEKPLTVGLVCLGDGHPGIWNLISEIEAQRIEILDWYHLKENLYKVGGSSERLKSAETHLWRGNVDSAIAEFKDDEGAKNLKKYLETHRHRIINYGYYQQEGISIGSGAVESSIKQIGRRIQISGAQWKKENVPQVLRHRCAYLNGMLSR